MVPFFLELPLFIIASIATVCILGLFFFFGFLAFIMVQNNDIHTFLSKDSKDLMDC